MKFRFIDPKEIIAVIVILIVLGVGVYAFFTTSFKLSNTGTITTPYGNNNVLSANRSIHSYTGAPVGNGLTWLNVTGAWNQSVAGGVKLQGYNRTTHLWDTVRSSAIYPNVTFIQANSTMRVSIRSFNGSNAYRWLRCYYSVNGTATKSVVNQSWKALKNESGVGATVFNILGICITISAIFGIITVIYSYMRPKR